MLGATLTTSAIIQVSAFFGIFAAIAVWETWAPRRARDHGRRTRWPSNLGIVALNTVLVRVALPGSALGVALLAEERGFGLLRELALPGWAALPLGVLLLDLAIYLQHVLFHAVPVLWRVHRMHHADLDFDVTTGARFHPLEIVVSALIKMGVVAALGASASAVLVFEIALSGTALFNHANAGLPSAVDRIARWFVVTPDMHRVHHSATPSETNRNFGFSFPWWDRLLGTYRAEPALGHTGMTIGIQQFRSARDLRLDRMLLQPFVRRIGDYPIGSSSEESVRSATYSVSA